MKQTTELKFLPLKKNTHEQVRLDMRTCRGSSESQAQKVDTTELLAGISIYRTTSKMQIRVQVPESAQTT